MDEQMESAKSGARKLAGSEQSNPLISDHLGRSGMKLYSWGTSYFTLNGVPFLGRQLEIGPLTRFSSSKALFYG